MNLEGVDPLLAVTGTRLPTDAFTGALPDGEGQVMQRWMSIARLLQFQKRKARKSISYESERGLCQHTSATAAFSTSRMVGGTATPAARIAVYAWPVNWLRNR
jgi:hypothetical protein